MGHSDSITDSENNPRKRVCKACDRCRLKKSKCDGESPCGRCQADDQICMFGERRRSHDKVYPKGYPEMLEQQQAQIIHSLRELYERVINNKSWPGLPLEKSANGYPLTHDILERLGSLNVEGVSDPTRVFQDDFGELERLARIKMKDTNLEGDELISPMMSRRGSDMGGRNPSHVGPPFHAPIYPVQLLSASLLPTPPLQSPQEQPFMSYPTTNTGMSPSLRAQSTDQMYTPQFGENISNPAFESPLIYRGFDFMQEASNGPMVMNHFPNMWESGNLDPDVSGSENMEPDGNGFRNSFSN